MSASRTVRLSLLSLCLAAACAAPSLEEPRITLDSLTLDAMKSSVHAVVHNPYILSLPGGELHADMSAKGQSLAQASVQADAISALAKTEVSGSLDIAYAGILRAFTGALQADLPVHGELSAKFRLPALLGAVLRKTDIDLSAKSDGTLPAIFPRLAFFFVPSLVGKNGFGLTFSNSGPAPVRLDSVNSSVSLQGTEVFKGERRPAPEGQLNGETKVVMEFDWGTLGRAAADALAHRTLRYNVQGTAILLYGDSRKIPLQFQKEGTLAW